MIYKTKSPNETQKVASELAKKIIKTGIKGQALVIAFEGELGAGKTTFIKAFAKKFGVKARLTSPTFVLMKHYPVKVAGFRLLVHIDAYRLKDYQELLPLGIKEILSNPVNMVLIEWSERVKKILPKKFIQIHIDHTGKRERKIKIIFK